MDANKNSIESYAKGTHEEKVHFRSIIGLHIFFTITLEIHICIFNKMQKQDSNRIRQYLPHQDPDAEPPKTMREIEEEKQAEKDAQQRKVFDVVFIVTIIIVIIFFTLMIQMA